MARFKVIALSLGGLRNKIFQSGDVVTQSQLPVDAAELVAKGFLQPLDLDITVNSATPVVDESVLESVMLAKAWPSIDDMTAKQIKAALGDKAPKQFMPKEDLYALLVG